jgi:hypothetical protein
MRVLAVLAMTSVLGVPAHETLAVEGAVQYPHGAEGLMAGALPPPGTYVLAYGIHYTGTRKDGDGNNLVTPTGANVALTVDAIALRAVHMTHLQLLGGQVGMHAVVPFFNNTLTVGPASNTSAALGDIVIDPFILAWHFPTVHAAVAIDVVLPTGAFSKTQPLGNNAGANYFSFEPLAAVTWFPGAGWEVDAKAMYNVKTRNHATDYRSGDEFHMDYTLGKALNDSFKLGLGGYFDVQIQGDDQAGVDVGNKARYFAVGPEVAYQAGPVSVIAKWQTELVSHNAFQGNRVIFKLVAPL